MWWRSELRSGLVVPPVTRSLRSGIPLQHCITLQVGRADYCSSLQFSIENFSFPLLLLYPGLFKVPQNPPGCNFLVNFKDTKSLRLIRPLIESTCQPVLAILLLRLFMWQFNRAFWDYNRGSRCLLKSGSPAIFSAQLLNAGRCAMMILMRNVHICRINSGPDLDFTLQIQYDWL